MDEPLLGVLLSALWGGLIALAAASRFASAATLESPLSVTRRTVWVTGMAAGAAAGIAAVLITPGLLDALRLTAVAGLVVATAWTDSLQRIIPNSIVGLSALVGAALAILQGWSELEPVVGAACAAATGGLALRYAGLIWRGEPGMGMGDIKLAAALGMLLGWHALWALYLGLLLAGMIALGGLAAGRLTRRSRLPFAPFVAAGTLAASLYPWPYG